MNLQTSVAEKVKTPEKMPTRSRRKRDANAKWNAVVVGIVLGGGFAALQVLEAMPRWSEVPDFPLVITPVVAVLLVTAALTERASMGLLCGAVAAISQFLMLLGFYAYSYTAGVALAVVPLLSLRVLTYPAAGIIGGYIAHRTADDHRIRPSRHVKRSRR